MIKIEFYFPQVDTQFPQHHFEDDFFFSPQNYDGYLKAVYGDYMQMPPMEDRENRHAIIDLSFKN